MPAARNSETGLEWGLLKHALIALGVIILSGSGWLYWNFEFRATVQKQLKISQDKYRKTEELYSEGEEAVKIIESSYPRFEVLKNRGFVGQEQHLQWIDQLHQLKQELNPHFMKYEISAARNYTVEGLTIADKFHVYETTMMLEIGLLHELDLFKMLDTLENKQPAGLFSVKECQLQRTGAGMTDPNQALLKAKCTLQWYTVSIDDSEA